MSLEGPARQTTMGCLSTQPSCSICEQQKLSCSVCEQQTPSSISPERALAYERALMLIEGGDYPSDDATALRTIAYRALMGMSLGDE